MPELRIGCSGFSYQHWKGTFYPPELAARRWLEHYSSIFSTVELNVTFYRLPSRAAFRAWYRNTPPDFCFSVKGSRFITHVKRLSEPREPLKKFVDGASLLKEKLKVVLWQFPPAFRLNLSRLASFLTLLRKYPAKHALEFRHDSWIVPDVVDLCRDQNVSLCMADWPEFIDDLPITADFVYIRRHGRGGSYATRYSRTELARDAVRIKRYLKQGKEVFVYFNNDAYGYAPANAKELIELLK